MGKKELAKGVPVSMTDSELSLLDDIVFVENDRRKILARENGLEYKAFTRSSFLRSLVYQRYFDLKEKGEM